MSMQDYRIDPKNGLEFGLYSLGDHMPDAITGEGFQLKNVSIKLSKKRS